MLLIPKKFKNDFMKRILIMENIVLDHPEKRQFQLCPVPKFTINYESKMRKLPQHQGTNLRQGINPT